MKTLSDKELKELTFNGLLDISSTKRIYKYIGFDDGLEFLINKNSIKFKNPNEFNDPFDCNPILFNLEIPQNEFKSFVNKLPFDRKTRRYLEKKNTPENVLKSLEYKRNQKRIYSFTKTNVSNLMWSHYAKNHTGLCIGFEFPIKYKDDFVLYPVNYPETFEVVRLENDNNRVLYYWLVTKSPDWEYEKEIRAINIKNNDYCTFEKDCIKEITVGNRISPNNLIKLKNELKSLKYSNCLEVNKIVINKKELTLETKKIST